MGLETHHFWLLISSWLKSNRYFANLCSRISIPIQYFLNLDRNTDNNLKLVPEEKTLFVGRCPLPGVRRPRRVRARCGGWGRGEVPGRADDAPRLHAARPGHRAFRTWSRSRSGFPMWMCNEVLCSAPSVPQPLFTITEKAPTRASSWLKAPTSTFTSKPLLLRH